MKKICAISGQEFEVLDLEIELRKKFGFSDLPAVAPKFRFRELGAFWQHWNLHKRKCDGTGKTIVSVFSENCPYPVRHKDFWFENANPPGADFDETKSVFEQMWAFFQKSPIPHNIGTNNENCEYTDDWWYSKNCYLSHSGYKCEDLKYCYRVVNCCDCQFCVFSFNSELCADLVNCENCFESFYLLNCRNIQNSEFLYDCRNCQNCLFCFNLRNKKYCFGNQQLSKDEFEKKKAEWNLSSRKKYDEAKKFFVQMMRKMAWHRALQNDKCENATGNFLENCKNCENAFFHSDVENAAHTARGGFHANYILDCINAALHVELIFCCSGALDNCYDCRFCLNITQSKFCEYSAFCSCCENCFGCCGLVGKKYHIFNKPYSKPEYEILKAKIIVAMKKTGEYGKFFPGKFAANPYDESWSAFYFPLEKSEQEKLGFRVSAEKLREKSPEFSDVSEIPDDARKMFLGAIPDKPERRESIFWDEKFSRPFQIQKDDVSFVQKLGIPLLNCFYMNRIQENFSWLFFNGELRKTKCARSGAEISTNWPAEFDGRILCEEEYLKILD